MDLFFSDYTYDSAVKLLLALDDTARAALDFHKGEHLQDGRGWIGPLILGDDAESLRLADEIKRGFVSENVIAEFIDRHASAVAGHEVNWALTLNAAVEANRDLTNEESQLLEGLDSALVDWWDKRKMLLQLNKAVTYLLLTGRATVRLFIPSGLLVKQINPATGEETVGLPKLDLLQSLSKIYVQIPEPDAAAVAQHELTMEEVSVAKIKDGKKLRIELGYVDPETGKTVLRVLDRRPDGIVGSIVSTVADATQSILSRILGTQRPDVVGNAVLDLGGRLTVFQMTRKPLCSPQTQQNQKLLNLATTMLARNVVIAGFLERVLLNAQLPGELIDDPENPGHKIFAYYDLPTGAGSTNMYTGVTYVDKDGTTRIANPDIRWRDPVDVSTFKDTIAIAYENIMRETFQLHALITGDATTSGESRRQALSDFITSLAPTKAQVDAMGRWLLETLLAFAGQFEQQPGKYAGISASFDSKIDAGPISADERRMIIEEVEKGFRSLTDGMLRLGIDDPDAMQEAIAAEKTAQAELQATLNAIAPPPVKPTDNKNPANEQTDEQKKAA